MFIVYITDMSHIRGSSSSAAECSTTALRIKKQKLTKMDKVDKANKATDRRISCSTARTKARTDEIGEADNDME